VLGEGCYTRSAPVPSYCTCSVSSAWARDERDELGEGEKRATTAASENQLNPGPAPVPVPHAHGQADPASCWVQRREKVTGCWYGISAGTSSAYFFCQLEPELKANQKWPAAPTCTPVCLQIADFRSQVTVHSAQCTVHRPGGHCSRDEVKLLPSKVRTMVPARARPRCWRLRAGYVFCLLARSLA
jgi:hypothetical protein